MVGNIQMYLNIFGNTLEPPETQNRSSRRVTSGTSQDGEAPEAPRELAPLEPARAFLNSVKSAEFTGILWGYHGDSMGYGGIP
jgi:hypothetical protein